MFKLGFEYLLERNARNDALMVGEYLLLGAPDVFDLIIPTFSKVLEKIAQEVNFSDFLSYIYVSVGKYT